MFSNQTAELSLNVPAKCLDAVRADRSDSRFVVGTCSAAVGDGAENHLHVLRFHSELNEFGVDGTLEHPTGPVGAICTCPQDKSLVLTYAEHPDNNMVKLWKLPSDVVNCSDELEYKPQEEGADAVVVAGAGGGGGGVGAPSSSFDFALEDVATLELDSTSRLAHMVWRDSNHVGGGDEEDDDYNIPTTSSTTPGDVLTLDCDGKVTQWDMTQDAPRPIRSEIASCSGAHTVVVTKPSLCMDPHNIHACAVTCGTSVKILDWRADTSLPTGTVSSLPNKCHRYGVTDVDYNPNKPHVLATAGQDGLVKFWDVRYANKSPILTTRGGHSHWVSTVSYNPFHDQLLVSTGTDSIVNLWRISSISSAPLLQLTGGGGGEEDEDPIMMDDVNNNNNNSNTDMGAANVRVARYEHADSVYDMTWGAADAWIYVTVGYDGKVVLNHVPSNEKYKILL